MGIAIDPAGAEETGTWSIIDLGGEVGRTTPTGRGVRQFVPKGVCGVRGVIGVNGVIGGMQPSKKKFSKQWFYNQSDRNEYLLITAGK